MAKILLVEDDPSLGQGLVLNLELDHHRVNWEQSLAGGRNRNQNFEYDLIVLDLNLPDGSGLELCREIRESGSHIPVIILTANTDEDSVVNGFSMGATDYVKKPFSTREFLARVKAALREQATREDQFRVGPVLVLENQRRVLVDGKEVDLTPREFDIFSILAKRIESVVSRENIISSLSLADELTDRTMDSHVSHIRQKLRKAEANTLSISSVYGVGYKLELA
jgi:two-component system OmpR family response regulator